MITSLVLTEVNSKHEIVEFNRYYSAFIIVGHLVYADEN